jgi:DNA (cytosine-5)-methyltransferase 1
MHQKTKIDLNYLSVCSGIEAATVAWHTLGWKPVAFGEIEKFPSQVLAHHYPNTPNWGDMTKFKEWPNADVDVFVGGTPCQSFSVAGLRKGLDDPRGNLMLTYLAIAAKYRPQWLVWENVPGVLSSNGGLDFASLLRGMGELGYGFAYRILDAQYFGVAQRRRRVFVVGYLGDWRPAAAVLFERHSLSGHLAPSREKRESVAANARKGIASSKWPAEISNTLDTTFGTKQGLEDQHVNAGCPMFVPAVNIAYEWHNQDSRIKEVNVASTLNCNAGGKEGHLVQPIGVDIFNGAFTGNMAASLTKRSDGTGTGPSVMQPIAFSGQMSNPQTDVDMTQTLQAKNPMAVQQAMAVRRLTPVECERLQGFPDNYTDIKHKGKPTPDGPRYKALGNSMAVPVMHWIGKRIQEVNLVLLEFKA